MILALLDSHKKTGQTERHNRLFCTLYGAPGEMIRGRRRYATTLSRACGARLEPPTAWFVARLHVYNHVLIRHLRCLPIQYRI